MAEMTKERWTKAALEMEPHLKMLQRIAGQAGMDLVSMAAYDDGKSRMNYIDDDTKILYGMDIRNGITELSVDRNKYYTKN